MVQGRVDGECRYSNEEKEVMMTHRLLSVVVGSNKAGKRKQIAESNSQVITHSSWPCCRSNYSYML